MKVLSHIFHLGVLFSGFAFIWFWLQLLFMLILPEGVRMQLRYFLQLLQSLFLGVLVLKFTLTAEGTLHLSGLLIVSLLTYFLYLLRNLRSNQQAVQFSFYTNLQKKIRMKNEWEWAVALISLSITILWVFYPAALESPVTHWFYVQTHALINTPVLGWIFKIAGFFFLLATLIRFLAAITWVLKPRKTTQASDTEDFDPFEEIK